LTTEVLHHGLQVMSLNELSFEEVAAGKAPFLVVVASSTGEGEPPDNGAKFYATMRSPSPTISLARVAKNENRGKMSCGIAGRCSSSAQ